MHACISLQNWKFCALGHLDTNISFYSTVDMGCMFDNVLIMIFFMLIDSIINVNSQVLVTKSKVQIVIK